jgi:hypothetical protein
MRMAHKARLGVRQLANARLLRGRGRRQSAQTVTDGACGRRGRTGQRLSVRSTQIPVHGAGLRCGGGGGGGGGQQLCLGTPPSSVRRVRAMFE